MDDAVKIQVEQLTKRFGSTVALKDVDLSVEPGERLALVGPNGSGKTTLLRTVMGMLGGEGFVEVGGFPPFGERRNVSKKLAYVPQIAPNISAPAGRLVDLISSTREMDRADVDEICRNLGFDFEQHAQKPFRSLSGGMKQKLLIALALAAQPQLLVMDEPTASLDAEARRRFFEMCRDLPEETTVVLCSHRLEEIRHLVRRIVALEEGRVVADAPFEDFVSDFGRAAIELQVEDPSDDLVRLLESHDFQEVSHNRFVAFVPREMKLDIVSKVVNLSDVQLSDLLINDLRDLDVDETLKAKEKDSA